VPANPRPVLRICPSEFPTAPIAEIVGGKFGMEGNVQADRPMGRQYAEPLGSRQEQDADLSTGDRGRLYGEMVPVSADLEQPIGNRRDLGWFACCHHE